MSLTNILNISFCSALHCTVGRRSRPGCFCRNHSFPEGFRSRDRGETPRKHVCSPLPALSLRCVQLTKAESLKAILAFKKKAHNPIGVQILSLEIHHHNQMGESPPLFKAVIEGFHRCYGGSKDGNPLISISGSTFFTMSFFGILSDDFVSFLQVTQMATWGK